MSHGQMAKVQLTSSTKTAAGPFAAVFHSNNHDWHAAPDPGVLPGEQVPPRGPFAYRSFSRRWEWLGWWQIGITFLITCYYVVIIGWVLSYVYYSFGTQWGADTNAFFFEE